LSSRQNDVIINFKSRNKEEEGKDFDFTFPVSFSPELEEYLSTTITELLDKKPAKVKGYVYHVKEKRYELVEEDTSEIIQELLNKNCDNNTCLYHELFLDFNKLLKEEYALEDSLNLSACLCRLDLAFKDLHDLIKVDDIMAVFNQHLVNDVYANQTITYDFYYKKIEKLRKKMIKFNVITGEIIGEDYDKLFDYYLLNNGIITDFPGFIKELVDVIKLRIIVEKEDFYDVSFEEDALFMHDDY
jgi:hypothetical protein